MNQKAYNNLIDVELFALADMLVENEKGSIIALKRHLKAIEEYYTLSSNEEKKVVKVNSWVQVHSGGKEPFYAKIKEIKDDSVILEGIYDYSNLPNRKPIMLPKDWCLPLDIEIQESLEYANKNNKAFTVEIVNYGK